MANRVGGDRNIVGKDNYSLGEDCGANLKENSSQVTMRSELPDRSLISEAATTKNKNLMTSSGSHGMESGLTEKSLPSKSTQPAFVAGNKGVEIDENSVPSISGSSFILEGMIQSVSPNDAMSLRALKHFVKASNLSGNTVFNTERRESLLEIAAALNKPEVLQWLLDEGANVKYLNAKGKTALDVAREKNHHECMKILGDHGAKLADDDTPNIKTRESQSDHMHPSAQTPVKPGITQTPPRPSQALPQPQQQFFKAMLENDITKASSLLETHFKVIDIAGIDPATNKSPLRVALESKNDALASLLIKHGAPVNAYDGERRTPVMLASAAGMKETVKSLIKHSATLDDIDKMGFTVMHHAASGTDGEIVKLLIDAGVNRDATDKQGCTALHHAAAKGGIDVVKELVTGGAKVDPKDKERKTPLWNACSKGNVEIVKLLLQKGAKAERHCGSSKQTTPLIAACTGENDLTARNMIALLIEYGASANVADKKNGSTPLMAATKNGLLISATYLLQEGKAMPNAVDKLGQTALFHADKNMVPLLNRYGVTKGVPGSSKDQN